jgi:hypothetical protein
MPEIAQGRVLRRLCEFCIFGCRELAFETVKEPVKHKSLTIVNGNPLARTVLSTVCAPSMARPRHPKNHSIHGVKSMFALRLFKNVVIGRALLGDLADML